MRAAVGGECPQHRAVPRPRGRVHLHHAAACARAGHAQAQPADAEGRPAILCAGGGCREERSLWACAARGSAGSANHDVWAEAPGADWALPLAPQRATERLDGLLRHEQQRRLVGKANRGGTAPCQRRAARARAAHEPARHAHCALEPQRRLWPADRRAVALLAAQRQRLLGGARGGAGGARCHSRMHLLLFQRQRERECGEARRRDGEQPGGEVELRPEQGEARVGRRAEERAGWTGKAPLSVIEQPPRERVEGPPPHAHATARLERVHEQLEHAARCGRTRVRLGVGGVGGGRALRRHEHKRLVQEGEQSVHVLPARVLAERGAHHAGRPAAQDVPLVAALFPRAHRVEHVRLAQAEQGLAPARVAAAARAQLDRRPV
mmetsp:Transcript_337/g.947  ORF Transcript_337/g.947 Transcript_337/m.947 type:complete len:380 (+) Transcript_337:270-1409(+)